MATATSEAAEPAAESVATLLDAEPVAPTPTPFAPYTAESLKEFLPDAPEAALGLFNKYQLSTEAVKDLVAYQTTLQQDAAKATATAWADHNKAWQDAVRADPVLGGAKLDQNLAAIKGLVTEYGDASFQEMLSLTGAGNHPGFLRLLLKISQAMPGEARPVTGQPGAIQRTLAERLLNLNPGVSQ